MEVLHTAINVSDLDEAKEFYLDVLGLEYDWEFTASDETNVYISGESQAGIQLSHDPDLTLPEVDPDTLDIDSEHLALLVDDIDEVLERVEETSDRPVVVEPQVVEFEWGRSKVAFVADSDGHAIELIDRLEGSPTA